MSEPAMPATVHRLASAAARRDAGPGDGGARAPPRRELDLLTLFILVVGLAPFVGLAIRRDWNPVELGVGAAMVIFTVRELLGQRAERLRRLRGEAPGD